MQISKAFKENTISFRLIDCILLNTPNENTSFIIWRHHYCWWRSTKVETFAYIYGLWERSYMPWHKASLFVTSVFVASSEDHHSPHLVALYNKQAVMRTNSNSVRPPLEIIKNIYIYIYLFIKIEKKISNIPRMF